MCALRLPDYASQTLGQPWPGESTFISETPKWMIYSLDSAPQEANELYSTVRAFEIAPEDVRLSESEWDEEVSWLRSAEQDFAAPDLQHILDHHFRMVERQFMQPNQINEVGWMAYQRGFIVITESGWKEHGVTAVHCDKALGEWKAAKCDHIPVEHLGRLESVTNGDDYFAWLQHDFDPSGSDERN